MKFIRLAQIVFLTLVLASCASTNIENIGSAAHVQQYADETDIWKSSEEVQEVIKHSGFIYEDPELTAYLNGVLHKVVGEDEKKAGKELKLFVLKDPMFNAFVFPNGTMYVHTGMLANLENEAQLATILGHEATHFFHRHALRGQREMINRSAFYTFFNISTAGTGAIIGGVLGSSMDLARILLGEGIEWTVYGYNRDLEREADENGFKFLVAAGYDPLQGKAAFERLLEDIKGEKIKVPYFYQTHPKVEERIRNFDKMIAGYKAKPGSEVPGVTHEKQYQEETQRLLLDNAKMTLMRNRPDMAIKQITRYLTIKADDARAYCLLGEAHLNNVEKLSTDKKACKKASVKEEIESSRKKAIDSFEKALALNSSYADAYRLAGLYYYKNNNKEKAKIYLSEYLKLEPNGNRAEYIRRYLNES